MVIKIILLFIAGIAAFWISAICGGGASIIIIPILNWLMPVTLVPFSLTIGTVASSASRIIVFKKHIRWSIFTWFVPFSIPAVLIGAWLIKFVNPQYLQLVVALLLLVNFPELLRKRKQQIAEEKPYPRIVLSIVGFLAGLVSGITGAIGLLFNRFYLRYGLSKEEIVATRAANEIFLHIIKLCIYILLGLYSSESLWIGLIIAIASIVSSFSVKYILPLINEFYFRKIGYSAMVFSGLFLFVATSINIIQQDKISITLNQFDERTLNWRNSHFILEFAIDEGLEIERPLNPKELPSSLKQEYDRLQLQYDRIFIEKVYTISETPGYEFYCYKGKQLYKYEFDE